MSVTVRMLWPRLALTAFVLVLSFYAIRLQQRFYSANGPFYDSVSYFNDLAEVLSISHAGEPVRAMGVLMHRSTVILPWLEAALIGQVVSPTRAAGVWIQAPWLLLLLLSAHYYFVRHRHLSPWLAAALSALLGLLQIVFSDIGGLSDFRFDLLLYLLIGTCAVWFLVAEREAGLHPWLILGLCAGFACLVRATAPLYLVAMLGPGALWRCRKPADRFPTLLGLAVSAVLCAAVSGWFYVINWDYIHYYYFVWNVDVRAQFSVVQALKHVGYPLVAMGGGLLLVLAIFFVSTVRGRLARVDWPLLYLGIAPVLLLIAMRAGPNHFVGLPAAFGLIVFALLPSRESERAWAENGILRVAAFALPCTLLFVNAALGWHGHRPGRSIAPSSYHRVLDALLADMQSSNVREARVSPAYTGSFSRLHLMHVLIYDYGFTRRGETVERDGLRIDFTTAKTIECAHPTEWAALPGKSDEEKVTTLRTLIDKQVDYLLAPTDETLPMLSQAPSPLNKQTSRLLAQLTSSTSWRPLPGMLRAESDWSVHWLRRSE